MRVLCLIIPHFSIAVESRRRPALQGLPIVIGGAPHERRPVLDCSTEAMKSGVRRGVSLRQAWSLCPEAIFLPPDNAYAEQIFSELLDLLEHFSPVIEATAPGCALLDIGRRRVEGSAEAVRAEQVLEAVQRGTSLTPALGAAGSRFTARAAALVAGAGQITIVPGGDEAAFLAPLPLSLLPCLPETARRLRRFGLRTLGDLAALPLGAVQAQFGPEGRRLWELAAGRDRQPLQPRPLEPYLSSDCRFEPSCNDREALMAAIERHLDELLPALEQLYRDTRCLTLSLLLENGERWQRSWVLQEPTHRREVPLLLLRDALHELRLAAAVEELRLLLSGLSAETAVQGSLFGINGQRRLRLCGMLESLTARSGSNPIKRITPLDPRSRIPERRHTLLDYSA